MWAEKTGRLKSEDISTISSRRNAATIGTMIEAALLAHYASTHPEVGVEYEDTEFAVPDTPIVAHLDGLILPERSPLEIKTSGIVGRVYGDWGESGDEVPEWVLVQVMTQIAAVGAKRGVVYALLGGRGIVTYEIGRHDGIIDRIIEAVNEFWAHVKSDTPPGPPPLDGALLRKLRREQGRVMEADDELLKKVQAWRDARDARREAERVEERLQNEILAAMGESERLACGETEIAFLEQSRRDVDREALMRLYPDVAAAVIRETKYRVFRERKA
jgi:predicted phage-related endonuclease